MQRPAGLRAARLGPAGQQFSDEPEQRAQNDPLGQPACRDIVDNRGQFGGRYPRAVPGVRGADASQEELVPTIAPGVLLKDRQRANTKSWRQVAEKPKVAVTPKVAGKPNVARKQNLV